MHDKCIGVKSLALGASSSISPSYGGSPAYGNALVQDGCDSSPAQAFVLVYTGGNMQYQIKASSVGCHTAITY